MKDDREALPALCKVNDEGDKPDRTPISKDANRLTAKRIERLKEPGRYHDGRGLYLQVTPAGSRSWLLRYARDGRERMLGLGPLYAVSLKDAREKARKARAQLFDGEDPVAERRGRRTQLRLEAAQGETFEQAAERYLRTHAAAWTNPVHRAQWARTLEMFAFPVIGGLPVASIDTDLVCKVLEPIWATKNVTAQRLRGRIEKILDQAKVRGKRAGDNPARWRGHLEALLAKLPAAKRHHPALPYEAIPEFIVELRKREGVAARALEVVILTAARTGEVVNARWSEINLAKREWVIPASRMKAKREFRIPLTDRVVEILEGLPHEANNPFVFVGDQAGKPLAHRALFYELRVLRKDLTVHGFRSSFRDWAGDCTDFAREVAEAALAHVVGDKSEQSYRRGDAFDKRRKLMAAWSAFCNGETEAANVVQFKMKGA